MIGKKLIELRTKKKMTQKDVAARLKISRSTYSNYESDFREPDFKNAELLADMFGVSVDYLLGRETREGYKLSKNDIDIIEGLKQIPESQKIAVRNLIDSMKISKGE